MTRERIRAPLPPPGSPAAGQPYALPPGTPAAPDPVNTRQFDETHIFTFDYVANLTRVQRFGPFPIYQAPNAIGRAEIQRIALVGLPTFNLQTRAAFQLNIYDGATQDFIPFSRYAADPDNPLTSGLRFLRYGALDDPLPERILLKSNSRLDVIVLVLAPDTPPTFVDGLFPVTIYTRVAGLIFVKPEGT